MTGFGFTGVYVPDNFLAGSNDFLESPLVACQPHSDDKTPGTDRHESGIDFVI